MLFSEIIKKEVKDGLIILEDNEICKYSDICPFTNNGTPFQCPGTEKRNLNTYFICKISNMLKDYKK